MKYLIMEFEVNGDVYVEEYNCKNVAICAADDMWKKMTKYDKSRVNSFFVLESVNEDENSCNHFDGDIVKEFKR